MQQKDHPIVREICKVAKIDPTTNDNWDEVLSSITYKSMELSDEDWLKLSNEAQKYVNDCVDALQDSKSLPRLPIPSISFDIPASDVGVSKNRFGGAHHSRKAKIPKDWIITLLVEDNPKRKGKRSWGQFRLYRDGLTVQEYIKLGGSRAGVNYDVDKKYIRVDPPKER